MKVLLVTMKMDIGGAETHILELARGLRARGLKVHIASAGGVFAAELARLGIRHETLPLDRRSVFAMLRAERGLKKLIMREKYDIVHAHARIPAFLCGRLQRKLHFRFVTTDHLDFRLSPLLKRFTNWGDFTFAVSEDLKGYLMENYRLAPHRIALTVNGVDTVRFAPKKKERSETPRLLHISRLDAPVSYCASALMDAVALLSEEVTLTIVGDGDHAHLLREKGKRLNEKKGREAILFAGAVADVKPYIEDADVVIAPSRAAMEGMASAKPVIVSGSQGHGGIFTERLAEDARKSNFCFRGFPLPTPQVLAREIEAVLQMTDAEREALGASCRSFIEREYSVERMVESQLFVYEDVVKKAETGAPDVLLAGYYGYDNLGDEVLLSVILGKLRKALPEARITVLSASPKETSRRHGVMAIHRFDLSEIRRTMKKDAWFLFGGGSLLQDKTSNRSLSYYLYLLRLAKEKEMKTAVFANGIGPLRREENRARVMAALSEVDHLSLRDLGSFSLCEGLSPLLIFDLGILVNGEFSGGKGAVKKPAKGTYFAVILKKMGAKEYEKLKETLRLQCFSRGFSPLFLSLFDRQDGKFCERAARDMGGECLHIRDAGELLSVVQDAEFVLSARLHGLVFATLLCVPMLPLTADEKLVSYMETIGMAGTFSPKALEKLIENGEALRETLKKDLPMRKKLAEEGFAALFPRMK